MSLHSVSSEDVGQTKTQPCFYIFWTDLFSDIRIGTKVGKSAAISQKRWRLSDGGMPPDHAAAAAVPPGFAFF